MNKKQLNIYYKGVQAYKNEKRITDCPYTKENDKKIWEQGYNDELISQTCDNPR